MFEALKYVCPKPLQIASTLSYSEKISDEDKKKYDTLRCSSNAKFFLACRSVIPTFEKYEFFYLLDESDTFKEYLMSNNMVDRDLFNVTNEDLKVYSELFSSVVKDICKEIALKGREYWDVEVNVIRNKSNLFSLRTFYKKYICKEVNREDYQDEWDYDDDVNRSYNDVMMDSIYETLCSMEMNENIAKFISEYEEKRKKNVLK